jgi:hypothetical protein
MQHVEPASRPLVYRAGVELGRALDLRAFGHLVGERALGMRWLTGGAAWAMLTERGPANRERRWDAYVYLGRGQVPAEPIEGPDREPPDFADPSQQFEPRAFQSLPRS